MPDSEIEARKKRKGGQKGNYSIGWGSRLN